MTFRFIIRPASIRTTPRLLKEALEAERTLRWPGPSRVKPSYQKDFFLTYPPIEELEEYAQSFGSTARWNGSNSRSVFREGDSNLPQCSLDSYTSIRTFASATKPSQRRILSECGFPIPWTSTIRRSISPSLDGQQTSQSFGNPRYPSTPGYVLGMEQPQQSVGPYDVGSYIVRPLRHTRGQGWRLTSSPTDFEEGREYIQEVYPKNHEYRVITVRGIPLVTLYKRRPEGTPHDQPWNHANGSSFITVTNPDNDRLRHTNVYEKIKSTDLFKSLDLIGLDIMIASRGQYVVTEVNLCPAVTLEHNLQRIKAHVDSDSFVSR